MADPRSSHHARLVFGLPVCLGLCTFVPGCDKLDEFLADKAAGEESNSDKSADADGDAKAEGDAEAAETDAAKKAQEEAKLAEAEAKKKAEEDANKPLVLSDISIKDQGGMFGGRGALHITAKIKVQQKIENGTYVHAKAVCKQGDQFMADTGYINSDYQKPLQQHEVGEEGEIQGTVFTQGIESSMSPCQIDFRLAGSGGGISVPLQTVCFDGGEAKLVQCDPPVMAPAMSGGAKPLEVTDLTIKKNTGFGSRSDLQSTYVLKINEPQDSSARLTLKSACQVGETKFVDMGQANLMAGPFQYESGESIARTTSLFWNPAFGFVDAPNLCDITVAVWAPKKGTSYGEYEEILLKQACFRDDKVGDGKCDPASAIASAPTPADADSLAIDNVIMETVEPYGAKGDRFQLKLQVDATVKKPVDQSSGVNAKVTCKVGKTARVETAYLYGIELYYLAAGETTRMSTNAFTSNAMEKQPTSCEAEFTAGRRFSPTGEEEVPLGKWCLNRGKLKKC